MSNMTRKRPPGPSHPLAKAPAARQLAFRPCVAAANYDPIECRHTFYSSPSLYIHANRRHKACFVCLQGLPCSCAGTSKGVEVHTHTCFWMCAVHSLKFFVLDFSRLCFSSGVLVTTVRHGNVGPSRVFHAHSGAPVGRAHAWERLQIVYITCRSFDLVWFLLPKKFGRRRGGRKLKSLLACAAFGHHTRQQRFSLSFSFEAEQHRPPPGMLQGRRRCVHTLRRTPRRRAIPLIRGRQYTRHAAPTPLAPPASRFVFEAEQHRHPPVHVPEARFRGEKMFTMHGAHNVALAWSMLIVFPSGLMVLISEVGVSVPVSRSLLRIDMTSSQESSPTAHIFVGIFVVGGSIKYRERRTRLVGTARG